MKQESLNNNRAYHQITHSEIESFKRYLPDIRHALQLTKNHFIGKIKTYVYVINNMDIQSLSISFKNKHFMHLCGVKYTTGAKGFISDLKRNKLKFKNLYVKDDGSTFQKLSVIDQIDLLDTLDTKVSIGNNGVKMHYDNLLRTKNNILGIAIKRDDDGINFPLSLLNLSVAESRTLTSFKVVAIVEENISTHEKKCLEKEKNCTKKVEEEISKLLSASSKTNH